MRKKPSSPYAELIEANKKILQEDGKYLDYSNLPKPYSLTFQQLTQFRIPQYFELLHRKNQKKTEIHQEFNQPNANINNNSTEPYLKRKQQKIIKRKPFSMSRFQTAQLERSPQVLLIEQIILSIKSQVVSL
ncbi:unnamed protein product [Paramecium octaurelia]|uniref:Uncharacterized protein n=1 Tax=Paramecium octaurelia TaxID=43137 RepID=A0A8S1UN12_PAROT|nr:unnamed protein product [Paramecium octaurelia]